MKPKTNRCLSRTLLLCFTAAFPGGVHAEGIFTTSAFTSDATSGVKSTKTYIAAANVVGSNVTVNGVTFVAGNTSGTNWSTSGFPTTFTSGGNKTTTFGGQAGGEAIDQLFDGFIYGGNPGVLTLSGLTAGQTYVTTLYCQNFSNPTASTRNVTATGSAGGTLLFNEDAFEASVVRHTFVATATTATINLAPSVVANTFHFYGMSNEQVFNNAWSSGANWTTATYSPGGVPNSLGTNVTFPTQGAPTSINLDAAQTVGHVQFEGTNAWTLSTSNASALTLSTDLGGLSVLSTPASAGSHVISAPVVLVSDAVKTGAGTLTFSGVVSGTKGITATGGILKFSVANTNTGAMGVATGALINVNDLNLTFGGLNGAGTVANNGAAAKTLTLSNAGSFSGLIADHTGATAGTLALTKTGTGTTQAITGTANTYSGITTINSGILNFASIANLGTASSLGNHSTDTGAGNVGLLFEGGTLQYTGSTAQSTNRAIRINTGIAGTIDASGSVPAATLSFTATSSPDFFENGGARTLALTGTNTGANTFAMKIVETGGLTSFTKSGTGTWYLTNDTSDYTGINTFAGGIANVSSLANYGVACALGKRGSDASSNVGLLFQGGTLQYTGSTPQSTNRSVRLSTTGGGGVIDASGSVSTATLSFTAATSADFFELGGNRGLTFTGTNTGNNTFNMAIGSAGGVTNIAKSGVGTWVLTGANTFTGTVAVQGGTLRITTSSGLGAAGFNTTSNTIVSNGAALEFQGSLSIPEHIHFQGTGVGGNGGLRSISGTTTLSEQIAIDANSTLNVDAGTLTVSNNFYEDAGAYVLTKIGAGTLVISGLDSLAGATVITGGTLQLGAGSTTGTMTISTVTNNSAFVINRSNAAVQGTDFKVISGTGTVTQAGAGTTTFTAANTYTGVTTISAGTLQLGNGSTTGSLAPASTITNNAALAFNRSDALAQGTDFGTISGSGSVTQAGAGTTTLGSGNTYTGDTVITAGVLAVNGTSIADAGKVVLNGGMLSIASSANETVNALYYGAVKQAAGTYGSSSSSATHKDDTRFAGTGIMTVVTGPYDDWIAGYPSITGSNKLATADPDGDGFTNLVEYAFGTDPSVSGSGSITYAGGVVTGHGQPVVSLANITNGVDYRAVFGRRTDYASAGLAYTVEFSADLSNWVGSTDTPTVLATDGTIDAVSVPYPLFITTSRGVEKPTFFRVRVSSN